jgi:hypothetical protein
MGDREIGEYWEETVEDKPVWLVQARTGTFTRHCELDAATSARNAVRESLKWQRNESLTPQQHIENLMEDLFPVYENCSDVAADIAMWANDYASRMTQ